LMVAGTGDQVSGPVKMSFTRMADSAAKNRARGMDSPGFTHAQRKKAGAVKPRPLERKQK